ncbi:trk system potassium uptake protein TrkA [Candidatus Frackibacter sp. WG12]|uniref:Trk system potassium transporter TrkA n=1 Tax=unclassified Candidatus Frackibacter TaxID=2648818 RepID=UPI000886A7C2|nr:MULTISPECIES: Trk system potassium transporter TrkA [unclassified Candidatus Frackibacter]SDC61916.1 trk system potassium uptake protein TrkA [Candidatus Frackibacter sp. WG11]SEM75686.1 trk system potassium uptake protein TrkA [Candidatus Frackibacter sp. WG12]
MSSMVSKFKKIKDNLTSSPAYQAIIYGGNQIGLQLADQLTKLGRDVVIIDEDDRVLRQAQEKVDVMALAGSGVDIATLKQAGISKTKLMIAVSNNDEKNILTSIYANKLGVDEIVAKINDYHALNKSNSVFSENLGIDLIVNPCQIVVEQIKDLIRPTMKTEIESFVDGRVQLSEVMISHRSPFAFNHIAQIDLPPQTLIISLLRRNRLFIPHGEHKIYPGDTVYILGKKGFRAKLGQLLSKSQNNKEKIVLAGGSNINYQLAKVFKRNQAILSLIEEDEARCEELVEDLSDILILHGKPTNIDLLKEEGIDQADIFVAAGDKDEANLLSGLAAKKLGSKKVIAIVNSLEYSYFSEIVNVDTILSPQVLVLERILDFLHQGQVESESILNGQMRLVRVDVPKKFARKGMEIKDLNNSSDLIIGIVIRGKELIIPDGDLEFKEDDQLLIFTLSAKSDLQRDLFGNY